MGGGRVPGDCDLVFLPVLLFRVLCDREVRGFKVPVFGVVVVCGLSFDEEEINAETQEFAEKASIERKLLKRSRDRRWLHTHPMGEGKTRICFLAFRSSPFVPREMVLEF